MDVYNTGEAYAGGNSVNFAVYVKQMGEEAAYLGIVGNDKYGQIMIDAIKAKEVDVSHVHVLKGATAITEVELKGGDRNLGDYYEGVFENFKLSSEDLEFIKQYDFLHTSFWGKCGPYLKELKKSVTICFDFADKLDFPEVKEISPDVHYAFFSYKEDDEYIRNYLREIKDMGPKCVVATLGENGSIAYDGKSFYKYGINKVKVVDTLGAGDSFIAGFMVGVSRKLDIYECLKLGADKAAETIKYFGAW